MSEEVEVPSLQSLANPELDGKFTDISDSDSDINASVQIITQEEQPEKSSSPLRADHALGKRRFWADNSENKEPPTRENNTKVDFN